MESGMVTFRPPHTVNAAYKRTGGLTIRSRTGGHVLSGVVLRLGLDVEECWAAGGDAMRDWVGLVRVVAVVAVVMVVMVVAEGVGLGQGRTRLSAPVVEFTVGGRLTGSIADYGSIQEAVDAAPEGGAVIRIREGVYRELVRVEKRGIRLIGDTKDPGKVRVVFANGNCGGACRATLTVTGDDFFAEGMTAVNDFGGAGAAGAVAISGDRAVLREVRMVGTKGTVRVGTKECGGRARCGVSRQYFSGCLVEGTSEMVSGDGRALFAGCELRSVGGGGAVVAEVGRVVEGAGLVFDHCVLNGVGQVSVGRPFGREPALVLLHTELRVGLVAARPPGVAMYAEFDSSGVAAGKATSVRELTGEEARGFEPGVFLRGNDKWEAEKVR